MRCPSCQRTQKYRQGLTCTKCGRRWVFHPKRDPIMDGKMAAAERRASSQDTFYFTPYQLFHAVNKLRARSVLIGCLVVMLIVGIAISFVSGWHTLAVILGIVLVAIWIVTALAGKRLAQFGPQTNLLRWKKFPPLLNRWITAGEAHRRLLTQPALHKPPANWPEKDLYDYGAERVLIVDDDLLVDLFVANGWHAANSALVLSISGYPSYIRPRIEALLAEAPHVPVFVLHGCAGTGLARRVQAEFGPVLAGRPVIDLGFSVADLALAKVSIPKADRRTASGAVLMPQRLAGFLAIAFAEQLTFQQWHKKKQHDDSGTYG